MIPSRPIAPVAARPQVGRKIQILVCRGPDCGEKRGSAAVHRELVVELRKQLPPGGTQVVLDWQSCFGQCQRGVNVMVRELRPGDDGFSLMFKPGPGAALYHLVKPEEAPRIVAEHVLGGQVIEEFRRRG